MRVERWGSLSLVLTECGRGKLAFTGPEGFGSEVRDVEQISRQQVPCNSRQAQQNDTGLSGSWFVGGAVEVAETWAQLSRGPQYEPSAPSDTTNTQAG